MTLRSMKKLKASLIQRPGQKKMVLEGNKINPSAESVGTIWQRIRTPFSQPASALALSGTSILNV